MVERSCDGFSGRGGSRGENEDDDEEGDSDLRPIASCRRQSTVVVCANRIPIFAYYLYW